MIYKYNHGKRTCIKSGNVLVVYCGKQKQKTITRNSSKLISHENVIYTKYINE